MKKSIVVVALSLLAAIFAFAGFQIHSPYMFFLNGARALALLAANLAVLAILIRRRAWRSLSGTWLMMLWCLPLLAMLYAHAAFRLDRHRARDASATEAQLLGRHFIVGYSSFAAVAPLAEKGLIAGIYVTRHNLTGRPADTIRSEISALQARRAAVGLPPLIVAADQEGGIVSHLSPPLTRQPALATLADLPFALRKERAEQAGRAQGAELAALGINLNFSPVVDLKPQARRNHLDFNTLIGQRAISDDPDKVAQVGLAYVQGLNASGVRATVKHFPGLGRVPTDTHHFAAGLDTTIAELEATDWRPFRDVLSASNALIMVGHVTLTAVDPDRPASHSKRVIDGILRQKWNYQGVVITDDLVMGAVYNHLCTAVVEALDAGVDLLLVAYDGSQFYRAFACATDAFERHELDMAALHDSEVRLGRTFSPDKADRASAVAPDKLSIGFTNSTNSTRHVDRSLVEFD
jgi:beta-N-acetylhexosaminidase